MPAHVPRSPPHHRRHHPHRRPAHQRRAPAHHARAARRMAACAHRRTALVEAAAPPFQPCCTAKDDRLVVVVGPCSIHDHEQALTYARLLKAGPTATRASCWWSCAPISKTPHHRGLEGVASTTPPGRQLCHQRRAGVGPPAHVDVLAVVRRWAAPNSSICCHRSSLPTWRLGCHRRTHHRKPPPPPPAGQRPELPWASRTARRRRESGQRCHPGPRKWHAFGLNKMGTAAILSKPVATPDRHVILRGGKAINYRQPTCRPPASFAKPTACASR